MLYRLIAIFLLRRKPGMMFFKYRGRAYELRVGPRLDPNLFQKIAEEAGILGLDGTLLRDPL